MAEGPLIFGSNRLEVGGWEQGDSGDSEDSKDSEDSEMGGLESVEGDEEDITQLMKKACREKKRKKESLGRKAEAEF